MGEILILDGGNGLGARLHSLLAGDGLPAARVGSVAAAERRVAAGGVDIVLLDTALPEAEELPGRFGRAAAEGCAPSCIAVIPAREAMAGLDILNAGAADVLRKPVDPRELRAKIRTHLELGQLRSAAHEQGRPMQETMDRLGKTLGLQRQFLSLVTHDLRTPLTTVKLTAEVLRDRLKAASLDLTPAQENLFSVLLRNILRIEGSFNEIMNVSRFDTRDPEIRPGPLDLNPLLQDAIASCTPRTHEADIRIDFRPARLPRLSGDARALHWMACNLLNLCLARMDMRDVATVETAADGDAARVRIGDTGPHLDPEHLAVLQQGLDAGLPAPRTRIGLYLAHRIARAHGGTLTLESAPGEGLAFRVELPLAPPAGDG